MYAYTSLQRGIVITTQCSLHTPFINIGTALTRHAIQSQVRISTPPYHPPILSSHPSPYLPPSSSSPLPFFPLRLSKSLSPWMDAFSTSDWRRWPRRAPTAIGDIPEHTGAALNRACPQKTWTLEVGFNLLSRRSKMISFSYIFAVVFPFLIFLANSSEQQLEVAPVMLLDATNFSQILERENLVLVNFYAPWCGHCKKVTEEYNQAAIQLLENGNKCILATLDGSELPEFTKQVGVTGYPSFFLYRHGRHISTYRGRRDARSIVDYITGKSGPIAPVVRTIDELLHIIATKQNVKNVIVGLFRDYDESLPYEKLSWAAMSYLLAAEESAADDITFFITGSPGVWSHFDAPDGDAIISVLPSHESNAVVRVLVPQHTEKSSEEEVHTAISELTAPATVTFSAASYRRMDKPFTPRTHVLFFCDYGFAEGEACLELMYTSAHRYRGRLLFVHVPHSETHVYQTFGIPLQDTTGQQVLIADMKNPDNMRKYALELPAGEDGTKGELTEQILLDFLEGYLSGSLRPSLQSEPAEDTEYISGHFMRVVGNTFNDIVIQSPEHVILFVVTPWCAYCKSVEPVIHSLAKLFEAAKASGELSLSRDVIVAKMDGSKNDIDYDGVHIRGFPTILVFRKSEKGVEVVEYNDERDIQSIALFVMELDGGEFVKGDLVNGNKLSLSDEL